MMTFSNRQNSEKDIRYLHSPRPHLDLQCNLESAMDNSVLNVRHIIVAYFFALIISMSFLCVLFAM